MEGSLLGWGMLAALSLVDQAGRVLAATRWLGCLFSPHFWYSYRLVPPTSAPTLLAVGLILSGAGLKCCLYGHYTTIHIFSDSVCCSEIITVPEVINEML